MRYYLICITAIILATLLDYALLPSPIVESTPFRLHVFYCSGTGAIIMWVANKIASK